MSELVLHGCRCWDSNGNLTLDVTDRITRVIYQGTIPFPIDAPTHMNGYLIDVRGRVNVVSEEFKKGTPFISAKNFNFWVADTGNTNGFPTLSSRVYFEMLDEVTMQVVFHAFSPGWSQDDLRWAYPCLDIDVMVGVY